MRTHQLNIRLSDEELLTLQRAAMNLGVPSIADAIRVLAHREVERAGKPHINAFDYDVLHAIREESKDAAPLGPIDLLNVVHAMGHQNRPRLGNDISAALQKLFAHRLIKPAARTVNCWLITQAGIEELRSHR